MDMRIGIDLGGTKIEGLALDAAGQELRRERVATPRDSYEAIVAAVANLVLSLEHDTGRMGTVGVGIPGIPSPATGLVKNANTTLLNGQRLDRDLSARLSRPVRLANDANCFALSEATDGAASPEVLGKRGGTVFGVILGTGVGGGVIIEGKALIGPDAIAGEWGHNPLPWPSGDEAPGPTCWCGLRACIELFLSGPGMAKDHELVTGEKLDASEIAERAAAGHVHPARTVERYAERLARALASIINVINPDAIVLGGGVSNIARLYDAVPDRWTDFVFSDVVSTRLLKAKHGDSSGVRGAAWLWPKDDDGRAAPGH
ncbi:MAG: ROK family protein [Polyangiaceae bacterium]